MYNNNENNPNDFYSQNTFKQNSTATENPCQEYYYSLNLRNNGRLFI